MNPNSQRVYSGWFRRFWVSLFSQLRLFCWLDNYCGRKKEQCMCLKRVKMVILIKDTTVAPSTTRYTILYKHLFRFLTFLRPFFSVCIKKYIVHSPHLITIKHNCKSCKKCHQKSGRANLQKTSHKTWKWRGFPMLHNIKERYLN